MLSDILVAADATKNEHGKFFNLIGAAIAFKSYHKFREEYFEIVGDFVDKYNLNFNYHRVLKTADLTKYVPTYNLSDARTELVEQILQSEQISEIFVTQTYIKRSINYLDKEMKGVEFARDHLFQYYPIVPLWQYYYKFHDNKFRHTVIDSIQGKITKAWKYVGKSSSMVSVIPHGDETHPCLSTADLICGYLSGKVYPPHKQEIYKVLRDVTPAYVKTEFINETSEDHLVPEYTYSLNPETFFPHPIILVKKSNSSSIKNKILQETMLYKRLLRYAERNGGCVTMEDLDNHHRILGNGDLIVCIDDDAFNQMRQIEQLNRGRGFKVISLDNTYQLLEEHEDDTS